MDVVLRTDGLSKSYGAVRALDGRTLAVGKGEVLGYLGLNGAGKTTTIRLLLGLITAIAGSAHAFGLDVAHHQAEVHARLAYVPGEATLRPSLTGAETLHLLAGIHGQADLGYQDQLVERFDFDPAKKVRRDLQPT
jgi:ABC-2 type transport system ATP-binding protein